MSEGSPGAQSAKYSRYDQALAAAAHELKTPLSLVASLAAALRDPAMPLTKAQQQLYLQRIELSSDRMLRLVEGLLRSYRLNQTELELEPVNLSQVCDDVTHELEPLARNLGQSLQSHTPRSPKIVVANQLYLRDIVGNLVDNALKHNPENTVVELRITSPKHRNRLVVRDSGPGFAMRDFRTMAERLGRHIQPLSGRAGSSGLGLYIAGQLTEAMGGSLGAHRHYSGGTSFYVDLPQSRQLALF